jgi:type I restriction enzyme M protein
MARDDVPVTTLPDGKICDFIDQRIRNDTPEEYVRQNIERRLVLELGYSPEQISVEFPIKMGASRKRVDLTIFPATRPHSQENVSIIIECKRDNIAPSNQTEGVEQLKAYLSACPNAEWGMWTNGKFKAVFRKVILSGRIEWVEPNDIPSADGDVAEVDRPTRDQLKRATDDNLLFTFKICHNHIYVTDDFKSNLRFLSF